MANGVNLFGLQPVTSGRLAGSFELYVDGKPYLAVLKEFEQPFAGSIAGSYAPGEQVKIKIGYNAAAAGPAWSPGSRPISRPVSAGRHG